MWSWTADLHQSVWINGEEGNTNSVVSKCFSYYFPTVSFEFSTEILNIVVFLSEEDRYDSYSRMILKYFLAEGVVCKHELFVAAAQDNPDDILQVWGESVIFPIVTSGRKVVIL